MFKNYRTYIIAGISGLGYAAYTMDFITMDQMISLNAFLAPFGLAFLRAAVTEPDAPKSKGGLTSYF